MNLGDAERISLENHFGQATMPLQSFTEFLKRNRISEIPVEFAVKRNNVITAIKKQWEVLLYAREWADVVKESHWILNDVAVAMNSKMTLVAMEPVSWAGPRLALKDAVRSLAVSAAGGAVGPVGTLLTQPAAQPTQFVASYLEAFALIFFFGLLFIYLTK